MAETFAQLVPWIVAGAFLPTWTSYVTILLGTDGPLAARGADVVVLDDDTVVLEHMVSELREAGCTDVHRRILRSLSGQLDTSPA